MWVICDISTIKYKVLSIKNTTTNNKKSIKFLERPYSLKLKHTKHTLRINLPYL